jgi:transcription-repair coupling factor (superfamily II helicase)
MTAILDRITDEQAFTELEKQVAAGQTPLKLGLMRSARLPVLAALSERLKQPILLLTQRRDRALAHHEELDLWAPKAERLFFPEPSALFYENAPWSETARRDRLSVLAKLALPGQQSKPTIITASARALMARTLPKADFAAAGQLVKQGGRTDPVELSQDLVRMGYESVSTVIAPGQFTRRGGILDLWPMQDELPSRLEFFGDELESLRRFDPASQRTVMETKDLLISPAREYLLDESRHAEAKDLSEFHIPLLHPRSVSLLDYLSKEALVLIDDL